MVAPGCRHKGSRDQDRGWAASHDPGLEGIQGTCAGVGGSSQKERGHSVEGQSWPFKNLQKSTSTIFYFIQESGHLHQRSHRPAGCPGVQLPVHPETQPSLPFVCIRKVGSKGRVSCWPPAGELILGGT